MKLLHILDRLLQTRRDGKAAVVIVFGSLKTNPSTY